MSTHILSFLQQLKKNNDRNWFQQHKADYEQAKDEFETLVGEILAGIALFDDRILGITPGQCLYRIYRDVRFSKNKSPYKTNFGALMGENGRKTEKAFYFIQIEPGNHSFVAGGLYLPPKESLDKVRQEIDYNGTALHAILNDPVFKKHFNSMEGDQLKRAPKGYETDHPWIDLLRHKSFLAIRRYDDHAVLDAEFIPQCLADFRAMKPFNDFLNMAMD